MRGMARRVGSHFCTFQGLLILMPIRKTTKSPSISPAIRFEIISAISTSENSS